MTTIHDVARKAKVSIAAVSLVLNNPNTARVGPTKRKIILDIARELNYTTNGIAKALISGQTRIVGLLVPMHDPIFFNYFIAQVLSGIQSVLVAHSYHLMIYSHNTQTGRVTVGEIQQSRFVDAMIVLNTRMCTAQNQRDTIADLRRANIPFVMANAYSGRDAINYVGMDDYQGGFLAGKTLGEHGHKRIAMISGAQKSPMSMMLLRGVKAGIAKYGGILDPAFHVFSEYNKDVIRTSLDGWLSRKGFPTAIFSGDDQFVPQIYAALQAKELRIPEDVAVLGRGNLSLGTAIVPPLTTIDVPGFAIGQRSAELILKSLQTPKAEPERIILPCELIMRNSL
ncbi:MAG TPA: LacI family DNA-binding transcriptional regulator [Acidobacteriaceae bacterium]